MDNSPRANVSTLFTVGERYKFNINNQQSVVGIISGTTMLDNDWIIIIIEDSGNNRNIKFSSVTDWAIEKRDPNTICQN